RCPLSLDEREIGLRDDSGDAVCRPDGPVGEPVQTNPEAHQIVEADLVRRRAFTTPLPFGGLAEEGVPRLVAPRNGARRAVEQPWPRVLGPGLRREKERPRLRSYGIVPLPERGRAERRASLGRVGQDVDAEGTGQVRRAGAATIDAFLDLDQSRQRRAGLI